MEAGDDHGVEYVVGQAAEAEVRQCPEAGGVQVGQDVILAGGGRRDSAGRQDPSSGPYRLQVAPQQTG
ncbi:hypothetical protein [Streptomyces sp. NPDC002676]